jgi:geranylgeranyl pyrophosphate synthase
MVGAGPEEQRHPTALDEQNMLLDEFRQIYRDEVSGRIPGALGLSAPGMRGRWCAWLYEPVVYVLDGRPNMFRSAFILATAPLADPAEAVGDLAVWIEIAWSCALMLDDIVDNSSEREGRLCAHMVYGRKRCLLAAAAAGARALRFLAFKVPGALPVRLRRLAFTVTCMARCLSTQIASGHHAVSLARYVRRAVNVNIICRWALLAAVDHERRKERAALRSYADAIAVLGKLRNDLLDYYGGSSERVERFEDFESQRWSFPTLMLHEAVLSATDRRRLIGHMSGATSMPPEEILALFDRYDVVRECLARIDVEVATTDRALRDLAAVEVPDSLTAILARWVRVVRAVCDEQCSYGGIY